MNTTTYLLVLVFLSNQDALSTQYLSRMIDSAQRGSHRSFYASESQREKPLYPCELCEI